MSTMSFETTQEVKGLIEELLKTGLFKSRSEIIREAIREMSIKYRVYPKTDARKLLSSKVKGKMSDTIKEVRAE